MLGQRRKPALCQRFAFAGIVVFICFVNRLIHSYWEWNVCLDVKICKCLVSNLPDMSYSHTLEVVGRGSEAQSRVGENLNYLI